MVGRSEERKDGWGMGGEAVAGGRMKEGSGEVLR